MKKYIYLFMILLSVVSCSDWLEEEPKSVAAETFYNTESEETGVGNMRNITIGILAQIMPMVEVVGLLIAII